MPCPFARFASATADLSSAYTRHYHGHGHHDHLKSQPSPIASSSKAPHPLLSEHLKHATAKAHREVESSEGVRKLMGFSREKNGSPDFSRLDYVRWMIMLACIYAALESALLSLDPTQVSMLAPLLQAQVPASADAEQLLHALLRFPATMRDVQTHLAILSRSTGNEEGAGLAWNELLEELDSANPALSPRERSNQESLRREMATIQQSCEFPDTATASSSTHSRPSLTDDHLALLTPSQTEATLAYVERLSAIARNAAHSASASSADLLLSHAYVRYLGDLSGGQHIRKRVEKLFPQDELVHGASGYEFYEFPAPSSEVAPAAWHRDLKNAFRSAMDEAAVHCTRDLPSSLRATEIEALLDAQGREASLAFELNKDLFEGLIGTPPSTVIPPLSARPTYASPQNSYSSSSSSSSSEAGADDPETELSGAAPGSALALKAAVVLSQVKKTAAAATSTSVLLPLAASSLCALTAAVIVRHVTAETNGAASL